MNLIYIVLLSLFSILVLFTLKSILEEVSAHLRIELNSTRHLRTLVHLSRRTRIGRCSVPRPGQLLSLASEKGDISDTTSEIP